MAENKKAFGQGFQDAVYGGIKSVYENPTVQQVGSSIKEGFFNLYDPVAAKTTEIGLPLLQTLTPEITTTQAARDEILQGIEPYKPSPEGMSAMDRLGAQYDRMIADFGAVGQAFFGDARNASEKLNQGIAFEDLTPEEQAGARMFGFDVATALIPGGILSKPAVKGATALGTDLIKPGGFKASAGGPPTDVIKKLNTAKPEISKEELAALSRFYYGLTPSSLPQNQLRATIIQADPAIFSRMEKDRRNYLEKVRKYGADDEGNPLNPGSGPKTGVPRTTKKSLLNDEKRKAIEEVLTPVWNAAEKRNGNAVLPKEWKNQYLPAINEKYPKLFADDPLTANKMSQLLGGYSTPAGKTRSSKLIDKVINEGSVSSRGSSLDKEVATRVGLSDKGGYVPTIARTAPKDLQDASRFDEFFTSQGINLKNLKNAEFDNKTAIRDYLQSEFRDDEILQKYLRNQPYNYNEKRGYVDITLNRSHVDRSIAAGDDVTKQFQGMDAGDIKILGATVNNVLQKDLERALVNYIKNKDVKNSKRIIGEMNDFFIGTKLNDPSPNFPKLNADDYKWLGKNKVVEIPTISVGAGRPFKNTDAVLFGTREQPSASEILKGELHARKINAAKRAYKREKGNVTDFYKLLNQGGLIGDMEPVKASVGGFFKKLFTDPPAFRKEGMDVTDLTGPTKAQTQTLEQLYPNTAFPKYVPGEVFFSNFDLALSKRDAPLVFNTNKEFQDYMNQSGVGLDELDDAKVLSFANSKFKEGQPVLAQDLLSIAAQSPVRNIFVDGYGFRSDKINAAPKTLLDYTGNVRVKEGEPVFKEVSYRGTGLLDGVDENTYRERVMRLSKEDLRGDPGSVPGGGAAHNFGDSRDNSGNYVMAWTRQTDRSGNIVPGQAVDRQTGEIVTPPQIADQTKLTDLETKINKLFEDPISGLQLGDDGQFLAEQSGAVASQVQRLVENSNGRLTRSKAYGILLGQVKSKQKQIKNLQNQYKEETARLQSFQPETTKEIKTTVIDELQSDVFQNAKRKATELAVRLQVMAEDGIPLSQMRDEELLKYFQNPAELGLENIRPGSVFRPIGKTKEELMTQYNELMSMQEQLTALAQQPAFAITPENVNLYRDTIKGRQTEILDEMSENISNDLVSSLYPDLPMKDRLQYADALSKQAIAEAAYRLFVEKDPNAPKYISFMSGEVVAGDAYSQAGRASTSIAERKADKQSRIDNFKEAIRRGESNPTIQRSGLPGVGTDEFYGGPLSKSVEGGHYTSTMESIFKKIAQQYGSKLEIINVAASEPRRVTSYRIINQDTGAEMGRGETYRQAERIANDLVDNEGGRYTIDSKPIFEYDTRPIFGMEITPQMLQLFKAYK